MAETIDRFDGGYRWLSNFWPSPVRWGLLFPTVEHAYQAAKAADPAVRRQFLACVTPGEAKRLGRRVAARPDWDSVRVRVMDHLLRQKFAPGTELAWRLQLTGDAVLAEGNNWGDTFWGQVNGVGQNQLGRLLMAWRAVLRKEVACG